MQAPLILKALEVIIFILMFSLGVNQSLADLRSLWRKPALVLRSLLALAVLFPLATGLLLKLLPGIPVGVAAGLAILAIATIARNLGLALLIAEQSGAAERITPTILGYALVSLLVAAPFSIWSKRRSSPGVA